MKKSLTISALVIIAFISFVLPGCIDAGSGTHQGSENYGCIYVIEPAGFEAVSLFEGQGSLVELYSPTILKNLNIPVETDYSLGYVEISPGNGTPSHYLLGSGEIIYVISGEGGIKIDGINHELLTGQAVFIPAGSVQSFSNTGLENLVYLSSVQPFYKYDIDIQVRGDVSNTTYKSHPEILISTPEENQQWNPSSGISIHAVMNPGMLRLSDNEILPGYSIAVAGFAPGSLIPEHTLMESNELDYILEGEIEIVSGDNSYTVKKGQAAVIPKGTIREIRNNNDSNAVLLSYVNPYWKEETSESV